MAELRITNENIAHRLLNLAGNENRTVEDLSGRVV